MPVITTPGLVLRRADYSDYYRMVTIFSPEMGRLDAIARGCRRPKSPLVNAVEPFTSGEFQLFERRERFTLEQCQISEDYYALRTDYDRLCHGAYWLRLLDAAILPDTRPRRCSSPRCGRWRTSTGASCRRRWSPWPLRCTSWP